MSSAAAKIPSIHNGSGRLAKAIGGSRVSATRIGGKVKITRFMELGGRCGRICCRGDWPRCMPDLLHVPHPEAESGATLNEPAIACHYVEIRIRGRLARSGWNP